MTADWRRYRVADLIEAHYSGPSPTCEERQVRDGEWGLLKTSAITWSKGWDWRRHKVPPNLYWRRPQIEVRPGDVLVTKAGPRHRVGVVAHVDGTPPHLMASGKMIGLRPKRDLVLPSVLAGLLSTAEAQLFLDRRTTGMAESQVNFANDTLLTVPVSLPPMPEQRAIAAILDALDDAIRGTERIVAKLHLAKQALLQELFTSGIDDKGGLHRHTSPSGPNGSERVQPMPQGWTTVTMEEAADPATPICYGIVQAGVFVANGPQVLTIGDLSGDFRTGLHRTSPAIDARYARSRVRPGDILISIKGTIGRIAVVPPWYYGNISRDLGRVRLRESMSSEFVRQYLLSPAGQSQLQRAIVGTTRAEVSIFVLKRVVLPRPRIEEQREIAERLAAADQAIEAENAVLHKLGLVKLGLQDDLVTGRSRVSGIQAGTAA